MTGHTKEPWVLRLNAGDETRIQADGGTGISLAVCDIKCGGLAGRTVAEAEQMAADIVARYNALAGIENPAAYVQAARGMAEKAAGLASDVQDLIDQRSDCGEWGSECPLQDAHKPDSTIDRLQALLDALEAFRAATGEA